MYIIVESCFSDMSTTCSSRHYHCAYMSTAKHATGVAWGGSSLMWNLPLCVSRMCTPPSCLPCWGYFAVCYSTAPAWDTSWHTNPHSTTVSHAVSERQSYYRVLLLIIMGIYIVPFSRLLRSVEMTTIGHLYRNFSYHLLPFCLGKRQTSPSMYCVKPQ